MAKSMPCIDGLEVHEVVVNGDDPRWQEIDGTRYVRRDPDALATDFPNWRCPRMAVRYVLLPCPQDGTHRGVMDEILNRRLTRPNRATTETILDVRQAECIHNPIAGICGKIKAVRQRRHVSLYVGYIYQEEPGRSLLVQKIRNPWRDWAEYWRFIAVVSATPLP